MTSWTRRGNIWAEEKARVGKVTGARLRVLVRGREITIDEHTTPTQIEQGALVGDALVCRWNGKLWDLSRPLTAGVSSSGQNVLEFLAFGTETTAAGETNAAVAGADVGAGAATLWHSSAHVLGQAVEYVYRGHQVHLIDGPATADGFFYDVQILQTNADGSQTPVSPSAADLEEITRVAQQICKEQQRFERLVVSHAVAARVFADNPHKLRILDKLAAAAAATGEPQQDIVLYRCGPMVDLCRGPHLPHTGRIKAIEITKTAGVSSEHPGMTRIYGVAFPRQELMEAWKAQRALAEARDHRLIGKQQALFMFHEWSPGSAFFLPHGTRIYNTLVAFFRQQYRTRGYDEVRTPLVYDNRLWRQSGHWQHYKDNMFLIQDGSHGSTDGNGERVGFGLKPMNCPGHCLLYGHSTKSYRDLPLRFADFSDLHRNEASGALTGLTRVRRFAQDDAHIFCTPEQVQSEVQQCLTFVRDVYAVFGFTFKLKLATRPAEFMGEPALWDQAEEALRSCLNTLGYEWTEEKGDGAFYGPKVDVVVADALQRHHQCATVQLDFQLPIRFDLSYTGRDAKKHRPVMIHRAILGSVERMLAILAEHTGGKWPLWLSPRQVMVCPVSVKYNQYAQEVQRLLLAQLPSLFVDFDETSSSLTLNKRIRDAQMKQYNFILVVGEKEQTDQTVTVRTRDNQVHGAQTLSAFVSDVRRDIEAKT